MVNTKAANRQPLCFDMSVLAFTYRQPPSYYNIISFAEYSLLPLLVIVSR